MAGLPPLMPGWTEHLSPEGQLYWYNESSQQSTYNRPTSQPPGFQAQLGVGAIPMYTGPPPAQYTSHDPQTFGAAQTGQSNSSNDSRPKVKKQKEKPAKKESILGADGWLRVTTTLGNIFYTHVESKRSEWVVPDEIKEYVEAMEDEERRLKALEEEEVRLAKEQEDEERRRVKEQERVQRLMEEEKERKKRQEELRLREEAVKRQRQERERIQEERLKILQEQQGKRKREEEEEDGKINESGAEEEESEKRARMDEIDDEEAWQREVAAEMAEEAAREEASLTPLSIPPPGLLAEPSQVELSLEEGTALFMHMLSSLNGTPEEINPMAPWDKELPKFIHQRDYTVLNSLRDRQDAFNEWCKMRIREKRNRGGKGAPVPILQKKTSTSSEKTEPNKGEGGDTLKQYRDLLAAEVQSTRTRWEEFKKTWKKDRRFFAFGRDDREREKVFRSWLKELGEVKRKEAMIKERDFVNLLGEKLGQDYKLAAETPTEQVYTEWSKVKRSFKLDQDARYEPVGSSSRRAELFEKWSKGKTDIYRQEASQVDEKNAAGASKLERDTERALREREEAVQSKRREVEMEKRRAFGQATRGESVTSFQQLLIDAVQDPLMSMSEAFRVLSSDGRFDAPGLRTSDKEDLIQQHITSLNEKRLRELQTVFERHAPSLEIEAEVALPLIKDDDEIERRHLDQLRVIATGQKTLKDLFIDWSEERERKASIAFQEMLKENAFVKFWGQLRQEHEQLQKKRKEDEDGVVRQGGDEEDEDEPDLHKMAAKVDLEEIHSILRNDQSYRAFRHKPQQREEWIRNHLQTMSVPKKTVFQRD